MRLKVQELLSAGLTKSDVAKKLDIGKSSVTYHAKRAGMPVAQRHDWSAIQKMVDSGGGFKECSQAFAISRSGWFAARRRGDLIVSAQSKTVDVDTTKCPANRRRLIIEERGHRCEVCQLEEWLGHPIPLELSHEDGDSDNNSRDNLKLRCRNCHGIMPDHKGRGRLKQGSRQVTRRSRYAAGKTY